MSNVVPFRPRPIKSFGAPIIYKVVDGETVECIDVDAMTPRERADFFSGKNTGAPVHKGQGAPDF
jgi:hypothetical protein